MTQLATTMTDDGSQLAIRMLRSGTFDTLYRDVMSMVDSLASYLDGPGRAASKRLPARAAKDYAILARELTAGAMRVANTVLALRGIREGAVSFTKGMAELKAKETTAVHRFAMTSTEGLPDGLLEFVVRCEELRSRAARLIDSLGNEGRTRDNPVHAALGRLGEAFSPAPRM